MKRFFIVLLGLTLCFLCGCNGYKEINRGYLVTALGISQNQNSTTIYVEAVSSSDVSDSATQRFVLTSVGSDIQDAFKNLNKKIIKPLYFEQLGTVIAHCNSMTSVLAFLEKNLNINLGIYIVKTNDIELIFNYESPDGYLGYDIIGLIKSVEKELKITLPVRLYHFYNDQNKFCEITVKNNSLFLEQKEDII